jgi:hypothetical protein
MPELDAGNRDRRISEVPQIPGLVTLSPGGQRLIAAHVDGVEISPYRVVGYDYSIRSKGILKSKGICGFHHSDVSRLEQVWSRRHAIGDRVDHHAQKSMFIHTLLVYQRSSLIS